MPRRVQFALLLLGALAVASFVVGNSRRPVRPPEPKPPAAPPLATDEEVLAINEMMDLEQEEHYQKLLEQRLTLYIAGMPAEALPEVRETLKEALGADDYVLTWRGSPLTDPVLREERADALQRFDLAPVIHPEVFAASLSLGRVVAFDPDGRSLLLRYGEEGPPLDPESPPEDDVRTHLEAIAREALLDWLGHTWARNVAEASDRFGKDRVVLLRVAGVSEAEIPDVSTRLEEALDRVTPINSGVTYTAEEDEDDPWLVTVMAPVDDLAAFLGPLDWLRVEHRDDARRVVLARYDPDGLYRKDLLDPPDPLAAP